MEAVGILLGLFLVTFLLGSIPFGLVISTLVYKKDIRKEGSGNIGTTNAMRSLGKVGGGSVFLLDFGKGVLSGYLAVVFAANFLSIDAMSSLLAVFVGADAQALVTAAYTEQMCLAIAFFGCTFGHIYSPWLKFKGGKGIAVAVGALFFVFGPVGALLELGLFAILVVITRYVSVGSIAAAAICPFLAIVWYAGNWFALILITITALNVVFAHRENIWRLAHGCENRIGSKKEKAA